MPQANRMIVTLEDNVAASEIMQIRGIASEKVAQQEYTVTPALRTKIRKAREESANVETVVCSTPKEMQQYFDSL